MSLKPLIDAVPAPGFGKVQGASRSHVPDPATVGTATEPPHGPAPSDAAHQAGQVAGLVASQVASCEAAVRAGRSVLITGSAGTAGILSGMAPGLIAAGMRVLRVRPPFDLPAFMVQVAQQKPPSATDHQAPDIEDDVLERGFVALTVPDQAGNGIVLLVEHAHRLPPETLRYVQFAIQAEPRLLLVLAGQPETKDILAAPAYAVLRARLSLHVLAPAPFASVTLPSGDLPTQAVRVPMPLAARGSVLAGVAVLAFVAGGAAVWAIARWPAAIPAAASAPSSLVVRLGPMPEAAATIPQPAFHPPLPVTTESSSADPPEPPEPVAPQPAATETPQPAMAPDPRSAPDIDALRPVVPATADAPAQPDLQPEGAAPARQAALPDEPVPSVSKPQDTEARPDVGTGTAADAPPDAGNKPAPARAADTADAGPVRPPPAPAAILPDAAPARVILRYGRNSAVGLARAADLAQALRRRGLQVADPVTASAPITSGSVGFFYAEDRRNAERIARDVAGTAPSQRRFPANGPLPPPGTIEVWVSGP